MPSCTFLEFIAQSKREEIKELNLFPMPEAQKALDLQYALQNPFQKGDIGIIKPVLPSKELTLIGREYLDDKYDFNLFAPVSFDLVDVTGFDSSVIDMPAIGDIAEGIFNDQIKCNFFVGREYEFLHLEECVPFTTQERNYVDYTNSLINNGLIYNTFYIFTGRKQIDTKLGLIGATALQDHFKRNIERNINQVTSEYLETSAFRFQQTQNIFRYPYDITTSGTLLGRAGDLIEKLTGVYNPFNIIPEDVFDLEGKSLDNTTYKRSLYFRYTGAGQKYELSKNLQKNKYRPEIQDPTFGVIPNVYGDYRYRFIRNLSFNDFKISSKFDDYDPYTGIEDVFPLDKPASENRNTPDFERWLLFKKFTGSFQLKQTEENLQKNFYGPATIEKSEYWISPTSFSNNLFNSSFLSTNISLAFGLSNPSGGYYIYSEKCNLSSNSKDITNPDLISPNSFFEFTADEEREYNIWAYNSNILFSLNRVNKNDSPYELKSTILYATQELVKKYGPEDNTSGVFIDSFKKEVQTEENGKFITISRGDSVTAYGDWGLKPSKGYDFDVKKGEFFRVFTKEKKYSKLNRAISHRGLDNGDTRSVLNNNGLVNIAPTKRQINTTGGNSTINIKKYMFSIENLAWSDNLVDLPECEIGPGDPLSNSRGRIMWFPPYNLTFSESSTVNWQDHAFIGRGEKIYTYNNVERTGTIAFSMIVDHPMVVNSIRGERTEIWERYFKGDVSVFPLVKQKMNERLSQKEKESIEERRKKVRPKIEDGTTITPKNKEKDKRGVKPDDATTVFKIYFPNNVSSIAFLTDRKNPNFGYQSKVQNSKIDNFTYFPDNRLKDGSDGSIPYVNDVNYEHNNPIFNPDLAQEIKELFDNKIFSKINEKYASGTTFTGGKIDIVFGFYGQTSSPEPINTTNSKLGIQRAGTARDWFKIQVDKYLKNNSFYKEYNVIYEEPKYTIDKTLSDITKDSTDINGPFSVLARNAEIFYYIGERNDVTPSGQTAADSSVDDNNNQSDNTPVPIIPELNETILEKLFGISECDMFDYLEINSPHTMRTISEKIKYFHPAFHSMTPQGFSGRLNFLHQCTRQGPSIGLENVDTARNFVFGRPPVCILRIGDFFHTKILIDSLQITYGDRITWDLNPEGFVAPMIAEITLGIKFIGGHSMTGPINRLQNALSFNYYSNMEMFDPRADSISVNFGKQKDGKGASSKTYGIIDGVGFSNTVPPNKLNLYKNKKLSDVDAEYDRFRFLDAQVRNGRPNTIATSENDLNYLNTNDVILLKKSLKIK
jgi:hypothetical protein